MLRIKRNKNKYEVNTSFDFSELTDLLPLEAVCAEADLDPVERREANYMVLDGDLYANRKSNTGEVVWWFFDTSTRRWEKCNDPAKEV